jgi:hypothetical protein
MLCLGSGIPFPFVYMHINSMLFRCQELYGENHRKPDSKGISEKKSPLSLSHH